MSRYSHWSREKITCWHISCYPSTKRSKGDRTHDGFVDGILNKWIRTSIVRLFLILCVLGAPTFASEYVLVVRSEWSIISKFTFVICWMEGSATRPNPYIWQKSFYCPVQRTYNSGCLSWQKKQEPERNLVLFCLACQWSHRPHRYTKVLNPVSTLSRFVRSGRAPACLLTWNMSMGRWRRGADDQEGQLWIWWFGIWHSAIAQLFPRRRGFPTFLTLVLNVNSSRVLARSRYTSIGCEITAMTTRPLASGS